MLQVRRKAFDDLIHFCNIDKCWFVCHWTKHNKFEDTKRVIKPRKSKTDRYYNGQRKKAEGQTIIYKTLYTET